MITKQVSATDAFLAALQDGDWRSLQRHYAPDVIFAANVPQWHFALRGAGDAIDQLMEWFPEPGRLTELQATETADGLLLEFEWRVVSEGVRYGEGVRQMHRFRLREGRIVEQRAYCIGHMDAAMFAAFESQAPSVTPYEF